MEIYVCDVTDPQIQNDVTVLKNNGKTNIIEVYGMSDGIKYIVDKIQQMARDEQTISKLVFYGHGQDGVQGVSRGTESSMDDHFAGISYHNFAESKYDLIHLDRYFKRNAVVELRGCDVANSGKGQWLLWQLAQLWNIRVIAGTGLQFGPKYQWFGKVHEANGQKPISGYSN